MKVAGIHEARNYAIWILPGSVS